MDRRLWPRNRAFWPAEFGLAFPGHHRPAVQQPQPNLNSVVQGLRNSLWSAIAEIKSFKEENKALKEQIGLLENREAEVRQLQEELRQKDDLLRRTINKSKARTQAQLSVLDLLGRKERKLKRTEEQWKRKCDALTNELQEQEQFVKEAKKREKENKMAEEVEKQKTEK